MASGESREQFGTMKVLASVTVVLVALSVVSSQDYSEEERKKIVKNRQDCIAETKVKPELIDRADQGDFVDDDSLKCFTKCFYQKAGFVTDTGALLLDTIKAKIPANVDKEKALKVIEECKQEGKNACETVYLVHKCYFQRTHVQVPQNVAAGSNPSSATAPQEAQKENKSDAKAETAKDEKKQ
ncbi:hypothetical protein NQ318_008558 [Aromia moschata]|uniref:Uncharacterized protein n=1 Tax=Aromia moschata TaxID=1265417 RepID=A0AAV8YVX7_9CUCU|nr:hypothetical protein NQ318_008558 [Aromia moschata]